MSGLRPLSLGELRSTAAYKALDKADQKAVDTLYEQAKGLDGDDRYLSKADLTKWLSAHGADGASRAVKLVSAEFDKMKAEEKGPVQTLAGKLVATLDSMLQSVALKRGDSGKEVEYVQQLLKEQGFYAGEVDGQYGASTQLAVRAFQQKQGLNVDGVVGPATHMKLAGFSGLLHR